MPIRQKGRLAVPSVELSVHSRGRATDLSPALRRVEDLVDYLVRRRSGHPAALRLGCPKTASERSQTTSKTPTTTGMDAPESRTERTQGKPRWL